MNAVIRVIRPFESAVMKLPSYHLNLAKQQPKTHWARRLFQAIGIASQDFPAYELGVPFALVDPRNMAFFECQITKELSATSYEVIELRDCRLESKKGSWFYYHGYLVSCKMKGK